MKEAAPVARDKWTVERQPALTYPMSAYAVPMWISRRIAGSATRLGGSGVFLCRAPQDRPEK